MMSELNRDESRDYKATSYLLGFLINESMYTNCEMPILDIGVLVHSAT
jgi:hypothetical protein